MAKKYRLKRKNNHFMSRILPDSVQGFVARRMLDATALMFIAGGAFGLLAIASYNRADPSLNTAAQNGAGVQNWMGTGGAGLADLLLQTMGLGAVVVSLCLAAWGGCLLARRSLAPFWIRFVCAVFAGITASAAFARLPSADWLPLPHLGGSGGMLLLQSSVDLFALDQGFTIFAWVWAGLAFILFCVACTIGFAELKWVGTLMLNLTLAAAYAIYDAACGLVNWVRSHTDSDFVVRERAGPRRKPILPPPIDQDEDDEMRFEDEEEDTTEDDEAEEDNDDEDEDESASAFEDEDDDPRTLRVTKGKKVEKSNRTRQKKFQLFDGGEWELPAMDLLHEPDEDAAAQKVDEKAMRMNAQLLQNVLKDFNVTGEITNISPGPVVTLYELEPAPGTRSSRVIGLADDIARSMSVVSVRAAVVPGRNVIGIELPNKKRQTVYLRDLIGSKDYEKTQAKLPLILGKDIGGVPVIADLSRMPHLLVAGTTGSGKSVAINTMILSLLYRLPPEKCRFIMIDPKMLELSVYDDIPHLLSPVVTEPGKAVVALKWVVNEMEERYRAMSKLAVRNIDGYNQRLAEARKKGEVLMRKVQTGFDPETGKPVYEEQPLDLTDLPYIVVIVDEFADLMVVAGKDVESSIQRLAQMARAAGIHLIMATQRPSVDVITGVIKANFPTRISFAVTSKIDSRTILGEGGAEQLLGQGDMLYMASGGRITRVHGPFASDSDVENVVTFLKSQGEPSYLDDITEGDFDGDGEGESRESACDELYDEAVSIVAREGKASTSFIQRHLQIGYNRAARIIEEMERQGVIGKANSTGKREVLVGRR